MVKKRGLIYKRFLKGLKKRVLSNDMFRMPAFVYVELVDGYVNHILKVILHHYLIKLLVVLEEVLEFHLAVVLMVGLGFAGLAEEMHLHLIS